VRKFLVRKFFVRKFLVRKFLVRKFLICKFHCAKKQVGSKYCAYFRGFLAKKLKLNKKEKIALKRPLTFSSVVHSSCNHTHLIKINAITVVIILANLGGLESQTIFHVMKPIFWVSCFHIAPIIVINSRSVLSKPTYWRSILFA
jgi:hypothetical protein